MKITPDEIALRYLAIVKAWNGLLTADQVAAFEGVVSPEIYKVLKNNCEETKDTV